ncbi:HDOD domain-containing protein [Spirochaetia bacterium 38H-sp]|uniref:HDOD domain-containing protein n=1 Tax=Rarispira pelagica TaxID=3141764 RepID=A0ABU9U8S3_9SPIR
MRVFKEEISQDPKKYFNMFKDMGFYIKVSFHLKNNVLTISVSNNAPLTRNEQVRIFDRIARARLYDSLEEALSSVYDDTEGAGLGIVIIILMLKKLGLDEDAFDIDVVNGETVARMIIPMDEVHAEQLEKLSDEIVKEIESLPKFPENVLFLQKLIDNPDSTIQDIARQISTDPSLTADLLKVVNSAQFMLPKKVDSILEGVKILGLRGLKNLLYTYGTQKILGLGTEEQQQLWNHSMRTAFYAYTLAQKVLRNKDLLDDAYVGGILHDMGKIVFSHVHPNLLERIEGFRKARNIPQKLLEDLYGGLNHAEIGARLAEKWNFPDTLIEAIRYHHTPHECNQDYENVVQLVYVANILAMAEDGRIDFDQADPSVLARFGMPSQEAFDRVRKNLRKAFDKEMQKAT